MGVTKRGRGSSREGIPAGQGPYEDSSMKNTRTAGPAGGERVTPVVGTFRRACRWTAAVHGSGRSRPSGIAWTVWSRTPARPHHRSAPDALSLFEHVVATAPGSYALRHVRADGDPGHENEVRVFRGAGGAVRAAHGAVAVSVHPHP
ncbi:Imm7 family immunity protein [Streptomyces sp. NPDC051105]|uniref:Imm7 family immunity protein n=1 Tax=Streptomyces sp. NPDC051105 TaxID=3154843 RepID=UPI00343E40FB